MLLSTDRILTSHVGSLPRPQDLLDMLEAEERGEAVDKAALEARVTRAIREIVARQVEVGIDIVNDGENSKTSYTMYVQHRLNGVGPVPPEKERPKSAQHRDLAEHPDLMELMARRLGGLSWFDRKQPPACIGPVSYGDRAPLERDLANLKAAADAAGVEEAFINAASPGVLTKFVPDMHYDDEDAYVEALAEALRPEYEAIVEAGFVLQIDAPDFGSARHNQYQDMEEAGFLKIAERNVEALNHACRNIPADAMRMHICWGNYEGPHVHDIPLASIYPVAMKAKPAGLMVEGANAAHAHEWEDLKRLGLPDDKVLFPGVIDSTSNFVENPRLVAQRIGQWADAVGKERVVAATDCGFATFAGPNNMVAPTVVWEKLKALAAGAALASDRLWRRQASGSSQPR